MNIVLWILQIGLALFCCSGGAYKNFQFEELAKVPSAAAMSRGAWGALGAFEIVSGILLVLPAATKWLPVLTPVAATAIALESLLLAVTYSRYSVELSATNPMTWVIGMGLVAAFIAYGRFALRPIA